MIINKSVNKSFLYYYIIISIILADFFSQYKSVIPGITLGELFLSITGIIIIANNNLRIKIKYTNEFIGYYFVALILTAFSLFISQVMYNMDPFSTLITRWIRYLSYIIFIVITCDNLDLSNSEDSILNIYRWLCILVSSYTILQFFVFLLFHVYLPIKVLPFPLGRNVSIERIIQTADQYYFRAYGPFVEPSYLTKFLLPGQVFSLYGWSKNKKKTDVLSFGLIIFAIACSTSIQGIAVMIMTVIVYFFFQSEYKKRNIYNAVIVVIIGFFILLAVYKMGLIDYPIVRLRKILSGSGTDSSSRVRLFRGFSYWWQLQLEMKILGVGMGNAANYADYYNIVTPYDLYYRNANTLQYMNGISNILVENGLICFGIFIDISRRLFRASRRIGRLLLFQFLLLMISGSSFFSISTVFTIFFVYHSRKGEPFDIENAS